MGDRSIDTLLQHFHSVYIELVEALKKNADLSTESPAKAKKATSPFSSTPPSPEWPYEVPLRRLPRTPWTTKEAFEYEKLLIAKPGRRWSYYASKLGKSKEACKNKYKNIQQIARQTSSGNNNFPDRSSSSSDASVSD